MNFHGPEYLMQDLLANHISGSKGDVQWVLSVLSKLSLGYRRRRV